MFLLRRVSHHRRIFALVDGQHNASQDPQEPKCSQEVHDNHRGCPSHAASRCIARSKVSRVFWWASRSSCNFSVSRSFCVRNLRQVACVATSSVAGSVVEVVIGFLFLLRLLLRCRDAWMPPSPLPPRPLCRHSRGHSPEATAKHHTPVQSLVQFADAAVQSHLVRMA
jgi:hypothetical protein